MSAPPGALKRFFRRLRWRLFWVFVAFGIGAGVTWHYREAAFRLLVAPAHGALSPYNGLPIYTSPTEMFSVTIGLAMKGGLAVAFPVFTFGAFQLLSPLLPKRQRRLIGVVLLPAVLLCFVAGAAFAYLVMLPVGLTFLLSFGEGIAVPFINIGEYISLVTTLMFWLGVVFNLPIAMFLLAKFRIISHKRFVKWQKFVPVTALILGALITPTFDAVNQTLVAVPIVVLYELGLLLAWLTRPKVKNPVPLRKRVWRRMCRCVKALWGGE